MIWIYLSIAASLWAIVLLLFLAIFKGGSDGYVDRPTSYTETSGPERPHVVLERLVDEQWRPFGVRPHGHHEIQDIRDGKWPGVRVQGE